MVGLLLLCLLVNVRADLDNTSRRENSTRVEEEIVVFDDVDLSEDAEDAEVPSLFYEEYGETQVTQQESDLDEELPTFLAAEPAGMAEEPTSEAPIGIVEETLLSNDSLTATNASLVDNSSRVFAKRVACLIRNESEEVPSKEALVQVVNGSAFLQLLLDQNDLNVTNRSTPAICSLGFFFASWCPFSAKAAPHFNGLARLFPDIELLAIDTGKYHGINTQFGIMALPSVILFHNSKPAAKYNLTEYELEQFAKYVTLYTGLEARGPVNLTEADFQGPIPTSEVPEPDYYLYLAWIFTVICAIGYFSKSSYCKRIIETIRNTWREAEMHEHQE